MNTTDPAALEESHSACGCSASSNSSSQESDTAMVVLRALASNSKTYLLPAIIILGLLGNAISFFLLVTHPLKKLSSSLYLAALALSDSGVLSIHVFSDWGVYVHLFDNSQSQAWCKLNYFLTNAFTFTSTWFIVAFTIERYIAVRHPLKRALLCTKRNARIVVTSLTLFAAVANAYFLVILDVVQLSCSYKLGCTIRDEYTHLDFVVLVVDNVVNFLLVFVLISTLNVLMIADLKRQEQTQVREVPSEVKNQVLQVPPEAKNQMRLPSEAKKQVQIPSEVSAREVPLEAKNQAQSSTNPETTLSSTKNHFRDDLLAELMRSKTEEVEEITNGKGRRGRGASEKSHHSSSASPSAFHKRSSAVQKRMTRMLVLISTTFMLFSAPYRTSVLYDYIREQMEIGCQRSERSKLLLTLAFILYSANFAVNFLLYCLSGRNFRNSLIARARSFRSSTNFRATIRSNDI